MKHGQMNLFKDCSNFSPGIKINRGHRFPYINIVKFNPGVKIATDIHIVKTLKTFFLQNHKAKSLDLWHKTLSSELLQNSFKL